MHSGATTASSTRFAGVMSFVSSPFYRCLGSLEVFAMGQCTTASYIVGFDFSTTNVQ